MQWPRLGWKGILLIAVILFLAGWGDTGSVLAGLTLVAVYLVLSVVAGVVIGFATGFWRAIRDDRQTR